VAERLEFNPKEAISAVATLIALLVSFLVEDPLTVYVCIGIMWAGVVGICIFHKGSRLKRFATGVILTALCAAGALRFHYFQLAKERADIYDHLIFEIKPEILTDIPSTTVTVHNDSHSNIEYRLVCRIARVIGNNGFLDIRDSTFRDHIRSGTLKTGDDSQYDDCLSDVSLPLEVTQCIDVKVRLFYSLEARPEEEKDHGFIAIKRNGEFRWEHRSAGQETSECQRFSKYPAVRPVSREEFWAAKVRVSNEEIMHTAGINGEKKIAAQLSTDIMNFGESMQPSEPQLDPDKDGLLPSPEFKKKWDEWAWSNAHTFHVKFDNRLKHVFAAAKAAHLEMHECDCTIISAGLPPKRDQTQMCGIQIGWFAAQLH
jgi:hypothetical protein